VQLGKRSLRVCKKVTAIFKGKFSDEKTEIK
jgi:hypothetical protein